MKKFLLSISHKPDKLFRLLFWKFFFAYFLVAVIAGLMSLFEIDFVQFNDQNLSAVQGFLYSILISPLMALSFTIGAWVLFMIGHVLIRGILQIIGNENS